MPSPYDARGRKICAAAAAIGTASVFALTAAAQAQSQTDLERAKNCERLCEPDRVVAKPSRLD
jgi:hypothetical protein